MGFLISILISVLFWWTLLRYSYSQKRVREGSTHYWDRYPWIDEGRQKFPIWMYLVAIVVSFIPIVNIIIVLIVAILYGLQSSGAEDNEGWELIDARLVLRAPYLKWIEWFNKKI